MNKMIVILLSMAAISLVGTAMVATADIQGSSGEDAEITPNYWDHMWMHWDNDRDSANEYYDYDYDHDHYHYYGHMHDYYDDYPENSTFEYGNEYYGHC